MLVTHLCKKKKIWCMLLTHTHAKKMQRECRITDLPVNVLLEVVQWGMREVLQYSVFLQ